MFLNQGNVAYQGTFDNVFNLSTDRFSVVLTAERLLLASSDYKPGMLLNIL